MQRPNVARIEIAGGSLSMTYAKQTKRKNFNGKSSKKLTAEKTSGRDGHIPMIKYNAVSTVLYLKDKKQMTSKIIVPMNSTECMLRMVSQYWLF